MLVFAPADDYDKDKEHCGVDVVPNEGSVDSSNGILNRIFDICQ